ncbi:MAG TPA: archaeosortase/exosortase family protein [Candidatus Saccharimonadales bacterium]|nr:archaeosortase/exosortase family protein [Candidatus Saccharimonadales bacterium]
MMHIAKTITPLLWRVIVFLGLFLLITGIAGPRIIGSDIMFRDGFSQYGGIGKALIFGLLAFVLLARHNKAEVKLQPWRPVLSGWLVGSLVCFIGAWVCLDNLLANERQWFNLVGAHAGLLASVALAAVGCFGIKNIRHLATVYKREILVSLGLTVLFYVFLLAVYGLWRPLASVVLFFVNALLGASGLHGIIFPPHTLIFDKFGITIAEFCSGVESIALFTSLYVIVGLLDWHRLNKRRYFIVFPFALLALFGLNIVRVYGLIMAGYYINPDIAFSLFHTYAGMVFFIIYSAIFWTIAYKYLVVKKEESHEA